MLGHLYRWFCLVCCLCVVSVARASVALVINGVTLVPIAQTVRWVTAPGHIPRVDFDATAQTTSVTDGETKLLFTVGSAIEKVGDKEITLARPVFMLNGMAYCPLDALKEALGWQVTTDAKTGLIIARYDSSMGNYAFLTTMPVTEESLALRQQKLPQAQAKALFAAVMNGDEASAEKLLTDNPALIYAYGETRDQPIHVAADAGQMKMITLLLAHGAALTDRGGNGATPLHVAVGRISAWGRDDKTPPDAVKFDRYVVATEEQRLETVKFLLAHGAPIDAADVGGKTALHYALLPEECKKAMAETLLAAGADATVGDAGGNTPMHEAALSRDTTGVALLLARKVDINIKNRDGETPLFLYLTMAKFLVQNGADINAQNNEGMTCLMKIVQHPSETTLVHTLIGLGANLDIKDNKGNTALHYAANENVPVMIKLLIASGANVQAKNNDGRTALDIAKGWADKNLIAAFSTPKPAPKGK